MRYGGDPFGARLVAAFPASSGERSAHDDGEHEIDERQKREKFENGAQGVDRKGDRILPDRIRRRSHNHDAILVHPGGNRIVIQIPSRERRDVLQAVLPVQDIGNISRPNDLARRVDDHGPFILSIERVRDIVGQNVRRPLAARPIERGGDPLGGRFVGVQAGRSAEHHDPGSRHDEVHDESSHGRYDGEGDDAPALTHGDSEIHALLPSLSSVGIPIRAP